MRSVNPACSSECPKCPECSCLPVVNPVILYSCAPACLLPVAMTCYYNHLLLSFIIYVLRSGVHVMGSGPALLSIHPRACLPAFVFLIWIYFLDRRQKEFFGWGGGYNPECRKRGGASMLIPSTSVTSHSRTCWCTGSGCSFYHRIYRIREDLLEQVITKKTK